jgi:hypothetical protein
LYGRKCRTVTDEQTKRNSLVRYQVPYGCDVPYRKGSPFSARYGEGHDLTVLILKTPKNIDNTTIPMNSISSTNLFWNRLRK